MKDKYEAVFYFYCMEHRNIFILVEKYIIENAFIVKKGKEYGIWEA